MSASRLRLRWVVLLGLCSCLPADEAASIDDVAIEKRLAATETRLSSIETKLDAIATKLDGTAGSLELVAAEASARKTRGDEFEARRRVRELAREQRELGDDELGGGELGSPDLKDPFTRDTSSRGLEGMAEGIECEGLETPTITCQIDGALLDERLKDPSTIARQARVVPSMHDGVMEGWKFYGIRRGSLPEALGFKNGDALMTIDGKSLSSPQDALDAYAALRKSKRVTLGLQRKGSPITLEIEIIE